MIVYNLVEVINMANETGRVWIEKEKLVEILGAFRWCSGSQDFQSDGQASAGWEKIVKPLMDWLNDYTLPSSE